MEMERSYYLVTAKPAYRNLESELTARHESAESEPALGRVVLEITQGGFGLDIVDDERQVKERFLEYLFMTTGIDLPRTVEAFEEYFELEPIDELINLDGDT